MADVRLRIQHTAERKHALDRLLHSLRTPAVVVTDNGEHPPNPWRGYQACLSDLPDGASHMAVLQDDTIACRNLMAVLHVIATVKPDDVVCLTVCGSAKRTAANFRKAMVERKPFCQVATGGTDYLPVVATLWPVRKAEQFLDWTAKNPLRLGHRDPRSDDAVGGRWMRYTRQTVWATVPSLVQHPDDVPSTIGKKAAAGGDRNRVAISWIGDETDPLSIDWAQR